MTLSINVNARETIGAHGSMISADFLFGDERETCLLPLDYWSISEYLAQWDSSASHVFNCRVPAAMITSIHDPAVAANLVAWVLYPLDGGVVKIQQHFLMHCDFVQDRTMIDYELLFPREVVSEDGSMISEWTVNMIDLVSAQSQLRRLLVLFKK